MANIILSETSASVSELKKNPMATYCIPAALYERILDELDDQELIKLVKERQNQTLIEVDLDQYL